MDPQGGPLPADSHVHTEWSWDATRVGDMDASCARAVSLGLPAVAFTEHVDMTPFRAGFLADVHPELVDDGTLTAPPLDVEGYLEAVERCRSKYRDLTILTGVEVGQPHLHRRAVDALVARGGFQRVLGSLHALPDGDDFAEPWELFPHRPAPEVVRDYLAEIPRVVAGSQAFSALAHIDYAVRSWPDDAGPFDPLDFEDELRLALRSVAEGERVLEINTRLPLAPLVVRWWREEGGQRVTFGSDAHRPEFVGHGFSDAAQLAAAEGFRPDHQPGAAWLLAG
ncbi:histidinol-phosphatase (PHP family) [Motilibacter peucedani]|uniref:Histidinol-phosphatase n=1 Tax=Motilibacter peucedani TaxID=598650 RepID=A0A420XQQ0_9ACTN|nr:PHP domain-containing protein [Motilibacter peucedani]RKS75638.1 histidinol-phosphatase (PHP family) [Motilibacter peucedani]